MTYSDEVKRIFEHYGMCLLCENNCNQYGMPNCDKFEWKQSIKDTIENWRE